MLNEVWNQDSDSGPATLSWLAGGEGPHLCHLKKSSPQVVQGSQPGHSGLKEGPSALPSAMMPSNIAVSYLGTSGHKTTRPFPYIKKQQKKQPDSAKATQKPSSLTGRAAHWVWCQGLSQDTCMCPERRQEEATLWICQACWLCQTVMHCRTLGRGGKTGLLQCTLQEGTAEIQRHCKSRGIKQLVQSLMGAHHTPEPSHALPRPLPALSFFLFNLLPSVL